MPDTIVRLIFNLQLYLYSILNHQYLKNEWDKDMLIMAVDVRASFAQRSF